MVTDTEITHEDACILSEDDVQIGSGYTPWRIASGKIVRGREEDHSLEEREKVVGLLARFAIQSGVGKDDHKPYSYLEADYLHKSEGIVRVRVKLTDSAGDLKPPVSAITYAHGLLDCAKNELVALSASQSKEKNRHGNYTTYANLWHVDPITKKTRMTAKREKSDLSMLEQWEKLAAELRKHPAYEERVADEQTDDEPAAGPNLTKLNELCTSRNWPTPEKAPVEWIEQMTKAYKDAKFAGLGDVTDEQWGKAFEVFSKKPATDVPESIQKAIERLKSGDKYEDFGKEEDPFK